MVVEVQILTSAQLDSFVSLLRSWQANHWLNGLLDLLCKTWCWILLIPSDVAQCHPWKISQNG